MADHICRRRFLRASLLAGGAATFEHAPLFAHWKGASAPRADLTSGEPPSGRIGKLTVSRLICGGNLFSGFAHSGPLLYMSDLLKNYFTEDRILDTLQACEEAGINTAILRTDDHIVKVLKRYRKERTGRIQWIAQTYPKDDDVQTNIRQAIDNGAAGAFVMGGIADRWVQQGKADLMGKTVEFMRVNALAAGVGSHSMEVQRAVLAGKLPVDFLFKTINSVAYESQEPAEIAALMRSARIPWIGFKVLGAGRTKPADGFDLAFRSGADFVNVGLYDFQAKEDVSLVRTIVARHGNRERPWA